MKKSKTLRNKNDQGFTLIELLVVILIIAILAAVGIIALISALDSGKKASATTVLRNGITAVRSWQTQQGQTTFAGITSTAMNTSEPDITWVTGNTSAVAGENSINIINGSVQLYMAVKSEKGVCYYARLHGNAGGGVSATQYASEVLEVCRGAAADVTSGWHNTQKAGWNK